MTHKSIAVRLAALFLVTFTSGCAAQLLDHPAWYCTGMAWLGDVEGTSFANLNADGTVFQTGRNWRESPLRGAMTVLVEGRNAGEVSFAIMQPQDFNKYVYRVEIRVDSVDQLQTDPSLARDNPHNGSNVYIFLEPDLLKIADRKSFLVALNREGHVWQAVPLDLSVVERGSKAMALADIELSKRLQSRLGSCSRRTAANDDIIIT